jgi:hypothetical protein
VADRTVIAAGVALLAIALILSFRSPEPIASRATSHAVPKPVRRHARVPGLEPTEAPSGLSPLDWQPIAADWLGGAVVTCAIPDVPIPNIAVIRQDPEMLPPGFPPREDAERFGDTFSFYVPPGPGHGRLFVEAVGMWEVAWPEVEVGEVEPCSSISERVPSSTIAGRVDMRGDCGSWVIVSGCDSSSEVDDDGSFIILDAPPGPCELRASKHDRPTDHRFYSPPTPVDIGPGESIDDLVLSLDCDGPLERIDGPDDSCDGWFLETTLEMMAVHASGMRKHAHPEGPLWEHLNDTIRNFLNSFEEQCPARSPLIARIASDVGVDLAADDEPPPAP